MKSSLSIISLALAAAPLCLAQDPTITATSINEAQAAAIASALTSYDESNSITSSADSLNSLVATATDYTLTETTQFFDHGFSVTNFANPSEFAAYASLVNGYITTPTPDTDGALSSWLSFYKSVATAEASIINEITSDDDLEGDENDDEGMGSGNEDTNGASVKLGLGLWTVAMVAAGAVVVAV